MLRYEWRVRSIYTTHRDYAWDIHPPVQQNVPLDRLYTFTLHFMKGRVQDLFWRKTCKGVGRHSLHSAVSLKSSVLRNNRCGFFYLGHVKVGYAASLTQIVTQFGRISRYTYSTGKPLATVCTNCHQGAWRQVPLAQNGGQLSFSWTLILGIRTFKQCQNNDATESEIHILDLGWVHFTRNGSYSAAACISWRLHPVAQYCAS